MVFAWIFTNITYDSIHSSNDTILKSESHWTGLKSIQPLRLSFSSRLIWRIILGRMIQLQTTTTNHIIDPTKTRRGPCSSNSYMLKRNFRWYWFWTAWLIRQHHYRSKTFLGCLKTIITWYNRSKQMVGDHMTSCSPKRLDTYCP